MERSTARGDTASSSPRHGAEVATVRASTQHANAGNLAGSSNGAARPRHIPEDAAELPDLGNFDVKRVWRHHIKKLEVEEAGWTIRSRPATVWEERESNGSDPL